MSFQSSNASPSEAGGIPRSLIWHRCLSLLTVIWLTGCTNTLVSSYDDSTDMDTEPAVTVKWQPACSTNISEPYFSVDVFTDGTVEYVGGPQAREIGERIDRLSAQDARRLINEARRFVSGYAGPMDTKPDGFINDESYCLDVTVRQQEPPRTKRGRSDVRYTKTLIKALDQAMHDKKWVCPVRYGGTVPTDRRLENSSYCSARSILRVYFAAKDTCASGHSISVFADRSVQYNAFRTKNDSAGGITLESSIVAERYFNLTAEHFDKLIKLVNSFQLKGERGPTGDVVSGAPDIAPIYQFSSVDEKDVEAVNNYLDRVLSIRWAEFVPDKDECSSFNRRLSGLSIDAKYIEHSDNH
jgi:hypothetical protein